MIDLERVAEAFGLVAPVGPAEPVRSRGQVQAWKVGTGAGPVLLKRFWAETELPWRDQLETAMELEALAVRAGIDTPAPVRPVRAWFGSVVRLDGIGLLRAFPYVEHRPLADRDDVADWLGGTLARIHGQRRLDFVPEPNWWYGQEPPVPPGAWRGWLAEGEDRGASWAPVLRRRLDLVLELADRVVRTFAATGPYVLSHRDVEPWNVLITESGPILIDWDTVGPESAPLEAAAVFVRFAARAGADPDLDQLRRSKAAYLAAGGEPLPVRAGILDRLIGYELSKIATALGRFFDESDDDDRIRDRLDRLPATVETVRRWERILARA
ncbi:phosphotransferase [Microlunatus sp. GCM10028923]|uniref:phosphotransferase n=1 Tax=Microlunatus sp. GCM10028923 TaxID=3273400 RepID=UPI00361290C2